MTPDPRTEEIRAAWTHSPLLANQYPASAVDIRYLLDRNKALEEETARLSRRVGMTKDNAVDDLAEMRAERDRYRAVAEAAREWRRVEDLVATSDEYRGSDKAIVAGNFLLADARSALLTALAALDGDHA